ncbi:MAG: 50S ribosomal protein L25/general stress protein Ctc [Thermodesulfovibrionales bacterium]|nr:50S ribosomal protein L25/general stress protein Ctc [Thermodesulfovibrionales bacterium]
MERMTLNVEKREEVGKGAARALRRKNMIPAILYRGGDSFSIKFPEKELSQFINTTAGEQVMVNLKFGDGSSRLALMKDYQVDPTKGELLHADFFEVSLTEEVRVTVHITIVGEPIGVRRNGGVLQYLLREIEVGCLPDSIPGHIEIDISGLEIGQSLHVRDLKLEGGIKVLTDPDEVIVNVVAPVVEEVAPAEVVAPEVKEPEVIKKGKKEEEG